MVFEASNAASYACDIEKQLRMFHGKDNELVDIGLDGIGTTLHGRDGIALSLQADALSIDGTKSHLCNAQVAGLREVIQAHGPGHAGAAA